MSLFEQCNGEIGPPGAAGIWFSQENRAESISHGEMRIERGREIKERVQQAVRFDTGWRRRRLAGGEHALSGTTEVLDRPNPVEVGRE
jgi:hypothetical protein